MLHQQLCNSIYRGKLCANLRHGPLFRYNQRMNWLRCSGNAKIYWLCLECLIHSRNLREPCSHPSWLHRLWPANSMLVQHFGSPDSQPNHFRCHLVWTRLVSFKHPHATAFHLSPREECHLLLQPPRQSANLHQSRFGPSPMRVSPVLSHIRCFQCHILSVLTLQVPLCLSIYHLSGCRLLLRVSP